MYVDRDIFIEAKKIIVYDLNSSPSRMIEDYLRSIIFNASNLKSKMMEKKLMAGEIE